jgi:hypothetical protein
LDQYGLDYYYGWGIAAGVHTNANAGVTTDDLSHMYNLTSSGFGATGDVYGGEVSYGLTECPYTKKRNQEALVMTGGVNFGDAAGVRTVVSGPLVVGGSRPQSTLPTFAQVMAQGASISSPGGWTLPATVTVDGTTYYRNYSGLLSPTAAQSTPPVVGSTGNIAGSNNSGTKNSGSGRLTSVPVARDSASIIYFRHEPHRCSYTCDSWCCLPVVRPVGRKVPRVVLRKTISSKLRKLRYRAGMGRSQ